MLYRGKSVAMETKGAGGMGATDWTVDGADHRVRVWNQPGATLSGPVARGGVVLP